MPAIMRMPDNWMIRTKCFFYQLNKWPIRMLIKKHDLSGTKIHIQNSFHQIHIHLKNFFNQFIQYTLQHLQNRQYCGKHFHNPHLEQEGTLLYQPWYDRRVNLCLIENCPSKMRMLILFKKLNRILLLTCNEWWGINSRWL